MTIGYNNTVLGYEARASADDASNEITLGNTDINILRCATDSITSTSDRRDKKDIVPLGNLSGIKFIKRLKPVNFIWNMRDGKKRDIPGHGFIAQDFQEVQKETGINIPGLVYDINSDKLEASYGKLIPIMVQAIKDLNTEIELFKMLFK